MRTRELFKGDADVRGEEGLALEELSPQLVAEEEVGEVAAEDRENEHKRGHCGAELGPVLDEDHVLVIGHFFSLEGCVRIWKEQ